MAPFRLPLVDRSNSALDDQHVSCDAERQAADLREVSNKRANERSFIASSSGQPHFVHLMFRLVSSLLIALSLLFTPLAMASGGAMAASHRSAMVMMNGQDGRAGIDIPSGTDRSDAMADCAVTCATFVAVEPTISDDVPSTNEEALVVRYARLIGIRPEGEKPPPRITPEI